MEANGEKFNKEELNQMAVHHIASITPREERQQIGGGGGIG